MADLVRAEDLDVGTRIRQDDVTLTKTADNVWQGNHPCSCDRQIDIRLDAGAEILSPLDPAELAARLAEIVGDPRWSVPLRMAAKAATSGRLEDRLWPTSLTDDDLRAALTRYFGRCRPGPLPAAFPDTVEKLQAWIDRNCAPSA